MCVFSRGGQGVGLAILGKVGVNAKWEDTQMCQGDQDGVVGGTRGRNKSGINEQCLSNEKQPRKSEVTEIK